MVKTMKSRSGLSMRDAFRIMNPGRFYWRLLVLFLVGAFFSSSAYQLSLWVDGLRFEPLFYTVLLGAVSFVGGDLRDGMVSKGSLERYLLWPMDGKRKMLWLYLRSSWIPGVLFFIGGLVFVDFAEPEVFSRLLYPLPYAGAALFLLPFITWRGSFLAVEVEGMVDVGFRMESGVGWVNFLLIVSPLGLMFLPVVLLYPLGLAMVVYGIRCYQSEVSGLQLGGVSQDPEERYPKWLRGRFEQGKQQEVEELKNMKNPLLRYYRFLEWEEHRNPLTAYLIFLSTVGFVVIIYYGLMGFFSEEQILQERGMILGLLISFGTYFIHHVSVGVGGNERTLLLPLETKKKVLGEFLNRFLRPTGYLLLNSVIISALIGIIHVVLHRFFAGQGVALLPLISGTMYYSIRLLPMLIAIFSVGEGIIKAFTLLLQRSGFYQIRGLVFAANFFLYLIPMVFSLFFYDGFIAEISTWIGGLAGAVYLGVFLISRWGIYQMSKKMQVIGL